MLASLNPQSPLRRSYASSVASSPERERVENTDVKFESEVNNEMQDIWRSKSVLVKAKQ